MFSCLNAGSLVYLLDKSNGLKYSIWEVVGTTIPQFATDGTNQMVMNVKVKVGEVTTDFNNIPSNSSLVTYKGGKTVIAETKQQIQAEVESILHKANYTIEHIDDIKNEAKQAEDILKAIDSTYAKDKARDEEIASLRDKVTGVESKLDKILDIVSNTNKLNWYDDYGTDWS